MIKICPRPGKDEVDTLAVAVSFDKLDDVVIPKSLNVLDIRAL